MDDLRRPGGEQKSDRWVWTVCRGEAELMRGEAGDAETALRSGLFAADVVSRLDRVATRTA